MSERDDRRGRSGPAAVTTSPNTTLPANWTQHTSSKGKIYYFNNVTGERSWNLPCGVCRVANGMAELDRTEGAEKQADEKDKTTSQLKEKDDKRERKDDTRSKERKESEHSRERRSESRAKDDPRDKRVERKSEGRDSRTRESSDRSREPRRSREAERPRERERSRDRRPSHQMEPPPAPYYPPAGYRELPKRPLEDAGYPPYKRFRGAEPPYGCALSSYHSRDYCSGYPPPDAFQRGFRPRYRDPYGAPPGDMRGRDRYDDAYGGPQYTQGGYDVHYPSDRDGTGAHRGDDRDKGAGQDEGDDDYDEEKAVEEVPDVPYVPDGTTTAMLDDIPPSAFYTVPAIIRRSGVDFSHLRPSLAAELERLRDEEIGGFETSAEDVEMREAEQKDESGMFYRELENKGAFEKIDPMHAMQEKLPGLRNLVLPSFLAFDPAVEDVVGQAFFAPELVKAAHDALTPQRPSADTVA